jgi:predicted deacylase
MSVVFKLEAPYRGAFELHRLTFGSGGPVVSIVAGLHGNELNAIHAVNLLIAALRLQRPKGTVHLFPVVNSFGADEGRKRWPFDDRDINRAFPGSPDGAAVERIAHALLQHTEADVCVDVHSGAPHVRELPQVRAPIAGRELELARAMGLPVVWRRHGDALDATGLVGAWREAGRHALHLVGGRGITLDTSHSATLARGLGRLLAHLGILAHHGESETVADVTRNEVDTLRASCGGFFVPEVRVGDRVRVGQLLGYLQSPIGGERLAEARSERAGVVMTVRAWPMVHAEEMLVRVAGVRE